MNTRKLEGKIIFLVDDKPANKLFGLFKTLERETGSKNILLTANNLQKNASLFYDNKSNKNISVQLYDKIESISSEIYFFTNGDIALGKYKEIVNLGRNVDLIITDQQMPIMDGQTLVNKIREFETACNITQTYIVTNSQDTVYSTKKHDGANDIFVNSNGQSTVNPVRFNEIIKDMIEYYNNKKKTNNNNNDNDSENNNNVQSSTCAIHKVIGHEETLMSKRKNQIEIDNHQNNQESSPTAQCKRARSEENNGILDPSIRQEPSEDQNQNKDSISQKKSDTEDSDSKKQKTSDTEEYFPRSEI